MSVLLSFAHPDDETFAVGGTARLLADRGMRVALVCATLGQRGATGGLCSEDELPAVRERELRAACAILGIDLIDLLGYQDQHLADAPPDDVRRSLVAAIRRERPRVVVTFDPNGLNGHPDHVAISRFTTDAVSAAKDSRWFPELGAPHAVERVVWPSPIVPSNESWRLDAIRSLPGVDYVIDTRRARDAKERALHAHATQAASASKVWGEGETRTQRLSLEPFRVGVGKPIERPPATDLLAR